MGIINVEPALITSPLPPIRRACVNCKWFKAGIDGFDHADGTRAYIPGNGHCQLEPGSMSTELTDTCSHFEPSQAVLDRRLRLVDEFEKREVSL